MFIFAVKYCWIEVRRDRIQHPANILGKTLGEVEAIYTNKLQHIHVNIMPPIDIPILAASPKA
jgi:hypothetical protein